MPYLHSRWEDRARHSSFESGVVSFQPSPPQLLKIFKISNCGQKNASYKIDHHAQFSVYRAVVVGIVMSYSRAPGRRHLAN